LLQKLNSFDKNELQNFYQKNLKSYRSLFVIYGPSPSCEVMQF